MTDLMERFQDKIEPGSREAGILNQLDRNRLPNHVAIIMDGNGRWASQRGLARVEGHRSGIESVKSTVEYSARLGIPHLTLYAFSAENWKRPQDEVSALWSLLQAYLRKELPTLQEHQIRFQAIGRLSDLPEPVREEIDKVQKETRDNGRMDLVIALNYSGRLELVDAFNSMLASEVKAPITESDIEAHLYTAGLPDPDLLIRTSGELRISNFLLWQIAYSEIYVSEVLWPDFSGFRFLESLLAFQKRERRYGGILTPPCQEAE